MDDTNRPSLAYERRASFIQERRASITKYVQRVKTVLSRKNTLSQSDASFTATSEPITTPGPVGGSVFHHERTRLLFEKYGLNIEPGEWVTAPANPSPQRVEKKIRMRVHRSCHRCQTTFGVDRVCINCQHTRCKKCPRYPSKKDAASGDLDHGKGKMSTIQQRSQFAPRVAVSNKYVQAITLPPGDARRPLEDCHSCKVKGTPVLTTFCGGCNHVRCERCPTPERTTVMPQNSISVGSDGSLVMVRQFQRQERTYRKPKLRVRWSCEKCSTLFIENREKCLNCGHDRCKTCIRDP